MSTNTSHTPKFNGNLIKPQTRLKAEEIPIFIFQTSKFGNFLLH